MANTETTTFNGRTVLLDFKKITMLHPTTSEYVTVTPTELKADATLLAAYKAMQPTTAKDVRREYDAVGDQWGYKKDGDGDIVNREGTKFKQNWTASRSLPDYDYAQYYSITMLDQGAAS